MKGLPAASSQQELPNSGEEARVCFGLGVSDRGTDCIPSAAS